MPDKDMVEPFADTFVIGVLLFHTQLLVAYFCVLLGVCDIINLYRTLVITLYHIRTEYILNLLYAIEVLGFEILVLENLPTVWVLLWKLVRGERLFTYIYHILTRSSHTKSLQRSPSQYKYKAIHTRFTILLLYLLFVSINPFIYSLCTMLNI